MKALRWKEFLSVHDPIIDNQHKELFELTNQLISNSNADSHSPIVGETLKELLKYARKHFKEEERFLERVGYPKIIEHKKMHSNFILKIAMFCKDVMDRKTNVTEEMINYLVTWLVSHVSKEDIDFKNYINQEVRPLEKKRE